MISHLRLEGALAVGQRQRADLLFRRELDRQGASAARSRHRAVPLTVAGVHLAFLVGVVVFAHHPVVFMGLFLFFLGFAPPPTSATRTA
jgi:hypothetical protein